MYDKNCTKIHEKSNQTSNTDMNLSKRKMRKNDKKPQKKCKTIMLNNLILIYWRYEIRAHQLSFSDFEIKRKNNNF